MSLTVKIVTFLVAPLLFLPRCQDTYTSQDPVSWADGQEEVRDQLIGTWYGNQPTEDGGSYRFISRRHADGKFELFAREYDESGERFEYEVTGLWGASGSIYITITLPKNWDELEDSTSLPGESAYQAYRVDSVDKEKVVYVFEENGTRFTAYRVSDDFEFPGEDDYRIPTPPKLTPEKDKKKPLKDQQIILLQEGIVALNERFVRICLETGGDVQKVRNVIAADSHWSKPRSESEVIWISVVRDGTFIARTLQGEFSEQGSLCEISVTTELHLFHNDVHSLGVALNTLSTDYKVGQTESKRLTESSKEDDLFVTDLKWKNAPEYSIQHSLRYGEHTLALFEIPE